MFDVLYQNAGNPPGPMELLNLWNRGYISEAEVDQGLRESRLKDKWIPALKNLSVRHAPQRTVTMLLSAGAISDADAHDRLRKLGYDASTADAIIKASHKTKNATAHHLTVQAIRGLYEDRIIDKPTAMRDLEALGYDAADAGQLLDLADGAVIQKYRNAGISRVHNLYVNHKIEAPQASTDLDTLGVPPDARDHLLTLWALERQAAVKTLTLGQLNSAYKKGLITEAAFIARVIAMGYDAADAQLIANIDVPPATP